MGREILVAFIYHLVLPQDIQSSVEDELIYLPSKQYCIVCSHRCNSTERKLISKISILDWFEVHDCSSNSCAYFRSRLEDAPTPR